MHNDGLVRVRVVWFYNDSAQHVVSLVVALPRQCYGSLRRSSYRDASAPASAGKNCGCAPFSVGRVPSVAFTALGAVMPYVAPNERQVAFGCV